MRKSSLLLLYEAVPDKGNDFGDSDKECDIKYINDKYRDNIGPIIYRTFIFRIRWNFPSQNLKML